MLTLTKNSSYKDIRVTEYQYINKYINELLKRVLTVDSWLYNKFALNDGVKKSCEIIKNENIDLVLCFANPYFVNVIGALVKKKTKVPLLIHYSDPFTHNPFKKISSYQLNKWKAAEKVPGMESILFSPLFQKLPTWAQNFLRRKLHGLEGR